MLLSFPFSEMICFCDSNIFFYAQLSFFKRGGGEGGLM